MYRGAGAGGRVVSRQNRDHHRGIHGTQRSKAGLRGCAKGRGGGVIRSVRRDGGRHCYLSIHFQAVRRTCFGKGHPGGSLFFGEKVVRRFLRGKRQLCAGCAGNGASCAWRFEKSIGGTGRPRAGASACLCEGRVLRQGTAGRPFSHGPASHSGRNPSRCQGHPAVFCRAGSDPQGHLRRQSHHRVHHCKAGGAAGRGSVCGRHHSAHPGGH